VEKLAIEVLDDADPKIVIDAATMLGQHGSADAEFARIGYTQRVK
jgi:hypothetical protein